MTKVIGKGYLTWNPSERRTDRYGSVALLRSGNSLSTGPVQWVPLAVDVKDVGRIVQLTAVVCETRESTHVGDLFRGVFPSTPAIGEIIVLGSGFLFAERDVVGVRPTDSRPTDWMDIHALYRCHEQLVELSYTDEL